MKFPNAQRNTDGTKNKATSLKWIFRPMCFRPVPVTREMEEAIGARPLEAYMGRDLLCVMDSEDTVQGLAPDMNKLCGLDGALFAGDSTRPRDFDCVSRSFAPKIKRAGGSGLRFRPLPYRPVLLRRGSEKMKSWPIRRRPEEGFCTAVCGGIE